MECTGQASVNGDSTNTTVWTVVKSLAINIGQIVKDVAGDYYFICTTAGTTASTEPTWNKTAGLPTNENSGPVVWTCIGAISTFSATWAAPHARLVNAFTATWGAAGNQFFVGDNHVETQAAGMFITSPSTAIAYCSVLCVDHTVAVPPGSSSLKTTASISTTGANTLTLGNGAYYYGITFNSGSGATNTVLSFSQGAVTPTVLDSCVLAKLGTTAATGAIDLGFFYASYAGATGEIILKNTSLQFGNVADSLSMGGTIRWINSTALVGSIIPNYFFKTLGDLAGNIWIEGVDFTALGSNTLLNTGAWGWTVSFINCKFPTGMLVAPSTGLAGNGTYIDVINSDSSATNYMNSRYCLAGSHVSNISVIRTGGASDGATPISWQISTLTSCSWGIPLRSMPISIWNSILSTNRIVTLYGIWNSASLPNNDQIWIDTEYLGSSATPIASLSTETKANILASGVALGGDSVSQWGSAATARLNSQSYSLGNIIYVASATNTGGIFFCTTAGTSNSTLPAAYASATDGTSVTDGGATFRAGTRFTLTTTLSSPQPAMVGYIRVVIRVGLPSSTFYVDPLITLG